MTDSSLDDLARLLGAASAVDGSFSLGGYRILKLLGQGGMGAVLLAEDPTLDRHLAIKVMKPNLASAEDRQRFLREARSAAKLRHDNIIEIWRVGEENGVPFIAMPLLEGESLEGRLKREPMPPLRIALKVGYETAQGLAAAHEKGLAHRDIKPANLWLEGPVGPFRRVKILDFGLAKPVQGDVRITQSGALLGTPAYMAPEQVGGRGVGARSDLFSLGVVLYQMLTGTDPFLRDDLGAVIAALLTEVPPPPRDRNPTVPAALSDLVVRLMAKRADDRPATAAEVAAQLKAMNAQRKVGPGTTRPQTPIPAANDSGPTATFVEPEPARPAAAPRPEERLSETFVEPGTIRDEGRPVRRLRWPWALAGVVTAMATVAVVLAVLRHDGQPASDHGPTTSALASSVPTPPWPTAAAEPAPPPKPTAAARPAPPPQPPPARARVAGERLVVPLPGEERMEFVWCPPGSFLMGSPVGEERRFDNETQHRVTFTKGFYLGRTEVTQAQWQAVMGDNPSHFKEDLVRRPGKLYAGIAAVRAMMPDYNLPVESVSWDDCVAFCRKMGERDTERRRFRLPGEAEWEYACRAGTTTPFSFGATITPEQVNYNGNFPYGGAAKGLYRQKTTPVSSFPANAWGLHDMHGNVGEWCADGYGLYAAGDQTDPPIALCYNNRRVVRGGAWDGYAGDCRAARRILNDAALRGNDIGFRVCLRLD